MDLAARLALFTPADGIAVAGIVVAFFLLGWVIEHPPAARPSVTVLMADYRRDWMRQFVTRQPRIFDASIIDNLRQASAFYVSTALIAIGGGVALIGNSDRLVGLARDLTLPMSGLVIEVKVLLVLAFIANALLKFVWAHRLFGYCAILMAAVPNDVADPLVYHRAAQAAEVNITAAHAFNRGMRSIYYALGALGWLLGPWVLMVTTVLTTGVLIRREFASVSRAVILRREV
jgi:uncharacterized membrane protein